MCCLQGSRALARKSICQQGTARYGKPCKPGRALLGLARFGRVCWCAINVGHSADHSLESFYMGRSCRSVPVPSNSTLSNTMKLPPLLSSVLTSMLPHVSCSTVAPTWLSSSSKVNTSLFLSMMTPTHPECKHFCQWHHAQPQPQPRHRQWLGPLVLTHVLGTPINWLLCYSMVVFN